MPWLLPWSGSDWCARRWAPTWALALTFTAASNCPWQKRYYAPAARKKERKKKRNQNGAHKEGKEKKPENEWSTTIIFSFFLLVSSQVMKALEPFNPLFYEEVVVAGQNDALPQLAAATSVPLATGERMFTLEVDHSDLGSRDGLPPISSFLPGCFFFIIIIIIIIIIFFITCLAIP
jgi:hypothetical protein